MIFFIIYKKIIIIIIIIVIVIVIIVATAIAIAMVMVIVMVIVIVIAIVINVSIYLVHYTVIRSGYSAISGQRYKTVQNLPYLLTTSK